MKINIFGKDIIAKEYACQKNLCNDLYKVHEPYINVYVKVTESCQADCPFCEFHTNKDKWDFNIHKMYYVLNELQKKIKINKISFTGGEVSMKMITFKKIVKAVKEVTPNSFTVVNTNGLRIHDILEMPEIDNVSLSRHHYIDSHNNDIFRTDDVPSSIEIGTLPNKEKLHFSCNLIKGYIDSYQEACNYLEWAASVGVYDVGFVTLMKVNDYCKEQHVDFRDLDITQGEQILHYQTWKNKNTCECRNYMFNPKNNENLVKVYARYNHDFLKGNESNLVFDGLHLREGFYGDIII